MPNSNDVDSAARIYPQLKVEQTLSLYDGWQTSLFANSLTACLTAVVLIPVIPILFLCAWLGLSLVIVAVRIVIAKRFEKTEITAENYAVWLRIMVLSALVSGVPWILAAIFFLSADQPAYSLLLTSVFSGSLAASALSWSAHQRSYLAFAVPTSCVFVLCYLFMGTAFAYSVAILIIGFLLIMSMFTKNAESALLDGKRLNFENTKLVAALTQQKEKAEQAFEIKTQFLASASHDLRQPLHASSMFIEALQNLSLPDDAREVVGKLQQSTDALNLLLHGLLDISRLDANVVEYNPERMHLTPLLQRLCEEAKQTTLLPDVKLIQAQDIDVTVHSDPVLLERILRNLIDNAAKFTECGHIKVTARQAGDEKVEIEISDTGPGIPENKHSAIFGEFVQLQNKERDRRRGLGLGLAIVKRLCELTLIDISLESEEGKGTIFRLTLRSAKANKRTNHLPSLSIDLSQQVIVVIDDEVDILEATRKNLAQVGATVVTAVDTKSAITSLMELDLEPTLLVSDLRLGGGKNGIDCIRQLREEYNTDFPALLLTGDTAPDRLQLAKDSGLEVLHKPVSGEQLKKSLARLIQSISLVN